MHAGATGPWASAASATTDFNKLYAALVGKREAAVHSVPSPAGTQKSYGLLARAAAGS
jgi:hypothetical protein